MADTDPSILEARAKLQAKLGQTQVGGKGSARRKKKTTRQQSGMDDKKLQSTLKRLGMNSIPGIEEVNMFKEDGTVLHFSSPKMSASLGGNTYAIQGTGELKQLQELLPGIISQLGPDNLNVLKKLAESMPKPKEETDMDIDAGGIDFEDVSKAD